MPHQSTEKSSLLPPFVVEWTIADPLASNSEAEWFARLASRDCEGGDTLSAPPAETVREP